MTATITRIPVAMKRGRKVTRGPKATVSVIFDSEKVASGSCGAIGSFEEGMAKLEKLAMARRAREVESEAQQEAWIDLSPNVLRWPANRRVRSKKLVRLLRMGHEDVEPEVEPKVAEARRTYMEDVQARRSEILAEQLRKSRSVASQRRVDQLAFLIQRALTADPALALRWGVPISEGTI